MKVSVAGPWLALRLAAERLGRVVAPDTGDLGAAVVGEYLRAHFRGRAYGEDDWAK